MYNHSIQFNYHYYLKFCATGASILSTKRNPSRVMEPLGVLLVHHLSSVFVVRPFKHTFCDCGVGLITYEVGYMGGRMCGRYIAWVR